MRLTKYLCCLFLLSPSVLAAPPREIAELMEIQKKALADAKELASSSLPDPKSWGEEWKRPWELPTVIAARMNSEQEYWDAVIKNMGGAGLSQADAEKVLAVFTNGFAQQGMTARDGLVQAVLALRRNDAPTAQQSLMEWESAAAIAKLAASGKAGSSKEAFKQMAAINGEQFKSMSDDELRATFLREATLIRKRTKMSFYRCNNWNALAAVKSDADIARQNLWIGSVDVKLMFADESRMKEIQDLPAAEVSNLEARLQAAVQASNAGTQGIMKAQLDQELDRLRKRAEQNPNDLDARRQQQEAQDRYNQNVAAMQQVKVSVVMRQFGDNSYVVRLTGVNPDVVGDRAGYYVGWIRKGHVMAEVSAKGRIPDAELSASMDHFLSEMDAKLASYDSSLASFMKIDPAGAATTPGPDTGSTSAAKTPDKPKKAKTPEKPVDSGVANTGAGTAANTSGTNATAGTNTGTATSTTGTNTAGTQREIPPGLSSTDPPEYQLAQNAFNSGDIQTSKSLVEQSLQKNPNHAPSLLMRGALRNRENDLVGALADFKRAAELDPNNANARRFHAFFQLLAGDAKIAVKEADAAIALAANDVETYLVRAQAAMAMDKPEQAKPFFDKVVQLRPNRASELYTEANTALSTSSYMVANLQFQTVLWMDPNQYPAHFGRGAALAGLGRTKQAIAAYERYLKSDGTSAYAQQARDAIKRLKARG